MALIHFAITLFVSAFILFLVQPLIGKYVLPKLGGTPQVWNTCMVFFQGVLLLGYFYTHAVTTRLKPRMQVIVHGLVLLVPFLFFVSFPFSYIRDGWNPPPGSNPVWSALAVLGLVVGVPFFVVATTAPLLQKWFGFTGHPASKDPYFLYGASNLGSMLSLLIYPVLIEPYTTRDTQTFIWSIGFGVLAVLVVACIAMVWKQTAEAGAERVEARMPETSPNPVTGEIAATAIQSKPSAPRLSSAARESSAPLIESVDGWRRVRWVLLAAVPSSMMLGVTSHITTDLSPIPLFWLFPLAFYLLSFILVFARWPVVWTETPHTVMVLAQPVAIVLMVLFNVVHFENPWPAIIFNMLGFALTVMVCHGELAKDRPSTRFLTEFYLWMSVGGVVGGMLNALVAPALGTLFPFAFELNLAIIAACFLRPNLPFGHWLDGIFTNIAEKTPEAPKGKAAKAAAAKAPIKKPAVGPEATAGLSYGLDVAVGVGVFIMAYLVHAVFATGQEPNRDVLIAFLAIIFLIAMAFFARGTRFGFAIMGIILAFEIFTLSQTSNTVDHRSRSYFGLIKVNTHYKNTPEENKTLIHGHINHGMNFKRSVEFDEKGYDPAKDFSRLATTYYHRKGPAGIVMEKFNWFKDDKSSNSYLADLRMPASLVGTGASSLLSGMSLPIDLLADCWSEPPYATIGLGTGTMASYARPFQHCHFYEIDDQIRKLSLLEKDKGEKGNIYFTYLQDALDRGAGVQVLMGDARQRMALPYKNYHETRFQNPPGGGPDDFYHMMVVDAFSSDAIPAHLLTKEAFEMYFKKLKKDGILCVHTSNRYVDLPRVVADVAEACNLVAVRGHDQAPQEDKGHFTSEWVMVARKAEQPKDAEPGSPRVPERQYLSHLTDPNTPVKYTTALKEAYRKKPEKYNPDEPYWNIPATYNGKYLWTDDYYNLLNILRVFQRKG